MACKISYTSLLLLNTVSMHDKYLKGGWEGWDRKQG